MNMFLLDNLIWEILKGILGKYTIKGYIRKVHYMGGGVGGWLVCILTSLS